MKLKVQKEEAEDFLRIFDFSNTLFFKVSLILPPKSMSDGEDIKLMSHKAHHSRVVLSTFLSTQLFTEIPSERVVKNWKSSSRNEPGFLGPWNSFEVKLKTSYET